MNVYKRPMFLQGGGPSAPMAAAPMAAAPMAAPPPNAGAGAGIPPELQMAMASAKQEGNAIGQGIGGKFVADMMSGLEGAEDYEQAINAIRGNQLPLSARYDELGEIVGEEDAKETPESVLALVQPAIMMTEEGAMNSGIGNLMQELTGDVSMEGPMEEGVGSLMAAGQPAEPPMPPGPDPTAPGPTLNGTPQGFAVGGAVTRFRGSPIVQNFRDGKEARTLESYASYNPKALTGNVQSLYEERLPLYEKVSARDPAADKAAFWAQMAQLGLNLAAPPPELRGRSPAEALAAAAKVPFANIAQLGARAGEGKRAARIGALQAAEKAQTAQQAAIYKRAETEATQAFRAAQVIEEHSFKRGEGISARDAIRKNLEFQAQLQKDLEKTRQMGSSARLVAQGKITAALEKAKSGYRLLEQEAKHEDAQTILGLQTNAAMERLKLSRQTTTLEAEQLKLAEQRLQLDRDRQTGDLDLRTKAQKALESSRSGDLALRTRAQTSLEEYRDKKWATDAENEAFLRDHNRAILALNERKAQARVDEHAALMVARGATREDLKEFNNKMLQHKADVLAGAEKDRKFLEDHRAAVLADNERKQNQLMSIRILELDERGASRETLEKFRNDTLQHKADVLAVDKAYKEALATAKTAAAGLNSFGKGLNGRILKMFSNKAVIDAYANGSLDRSNPDKVLELTNAITYWQQKKFGQMPDGTSGWLPGNTLDDYVKQAVERRGVMIEARRKAGDRNVGNMVTPIIGAENADGDIQTGGDNIIRGDGRVPPPPPPTVIGTGRETEAVRATDAEVGIGLPTLTAELSQVQRDTAKEIMQNIEEARKDIAGADIEAATGLPKAIALAGSFLASTFRDFNMFGKGVGWSDFSKAPEVTALINRLQLSVKTAVKEFGSRTAWLELEDIEKKLMPPPSVFTTDDEAAAGYLETSKWLAQQVAKAQSIVDNPTEYSRDPRTLSKAKQALPMYSALQGSFIALHEAVRGGGEGGSTPDKEDAIQRAMDVGRTRK